MSIKVQKTPPVWAEAGGPNGLDDAVDLLYTQWRSGRQIVVLAGAGISVQSGFPALASLGANLLMTYALQQHRLYVPGIDGPLPTAQTFSLERDGWSSPQFFPEYYGCDQVGVIRQAIRDKLGPDVTVNRSGLDSLEQWPVSMLNEFAKSTLGLDWFNLLDLIAENRPELVESLFDALGVNVQPGAAHNLLAHFVTWFNVRLILTTNFDNLIELSLQSESQMPYVFDVHVEAPPPSRSLIREHLSVIKLHGSHYGIRADRTINTPLDEGHQATLLSYFEDDAVLVVLDYSGHDARFMGLMRQLMLAQSSKRTIIRVDAIASHRESPFWKLATDLAQAGHAEQPWDDLAGKRYRRLIDIYYPHSRLFLLDVFQKCSGKLPNTRTGFSIIPHTPAPFKLDVTFGNTPDYLEKRPEADERLAGGDAWAVTDAINGVFSKRPTEPYRFGVVTGMAGSGVSQFLSQVAELLFKTHQHLWCDVDEAVSVGTLVAWLYEFVLNRQPDHPTDPLPLDLPPVEVIDDDLGLRGLARTASALWNRLKRDRYLIVIDSISYALSELSGIDTKNKDRGGPRRSREAKRLLVFLSMLSWLANRDGADAQCVLLIGTHIPDPRLPGQKCLSDLAHECRARIEKAVDGESKGILTELHSEARGEEIADLVQMIIGTEAMQKAAALHCKADIGMGDTASRICHVARVGDNTLFAELKRVGQDHVHMRRMFVKVSGLRDTYQYTACGPNGGVHFRGNSDQFIEYMFDSSSNELAWADGSNDERHVSKSCLRRFFEEMALCNRPRSWAQLLALPSIEPLAVRISQAGILDTDKDPNTRAVRALVDLSIRCGALRLQPGAFYYMDGLLRKSLRPDETDKVYSGRANRSAGSSLSGYVSEVHRKMLRYYERVYNLSGDVTAINYFYYHTHEYLHCVRDDLGLYRAGLEELGRGLLENSVQARGHLNAYDHAYLLLRLVKMIDQQNDDTEPTRNLRRLIFRALSNLYEDADDAGGCEAIVRRRQQNGELPSPPIQGQEGDIEYWYLKQKIYTQRIDLFRACAAGLLGLVTACGQGLAEGAGSRLMGLAEAPSGSSLLEPDQSFVADTLSGVFRGLAAGQEPDLRSALVEQNRQHWPSSPTIHHIIILLARTFIRLCCFSGLPRLTFTDPSKEMYKLATNLISAGKMLLASCADQDSAETKRLWTLYHCTRAKASLYSTTSQDYHRYGFSKDLYCVGLAKSYAIRAGGLEGIGAEGFASLQESEILIWEARMLMSRHHWRQAIARQGAAIRELAEARSKFVCGRVSLVRWRELAILLAGASLDNVKVKLCQVKPELNALITARPKKPKAKGGQALPLVVSEVAQKLEQLGAQIIFQLPIVWDDPWMEARLWFQVQRMVFYAWGTLVMVVDLLQAPDYFPEDRRQEEQARLVTAANRCLRALRLIGGYDTGVLTLPDTKEHKGLTTTAWDKAVSDGLALLWERVCERIGRTSRRMEHSGVFIGSISKIQNASERLYSEMQPSASGESRTWKDIDKVKWVSNACETGMVLFGHGDI